MDLTDINIWMVLGFLLASVGVTSNDSLQSLHPEPTA